MIMLHANGANIPALGLGTWQLKGDECASIVEQALRDGYRHIDTAIMHVETVGCDGAGFIPPIGLQSGGEPPIP